MNNAEFCDRIGFNSGLEKDLAAAIRDVTTRLCKLDPDSIIPSTDTNYLAKKTFDGWDNDAFLLELERVLNVPLAGVHLPNFTLERFFFLHNRPKPTNYGEWVKSIVEMLAPTVAMRRKEKDGF